MLIQCATWISHQHKQLAVYAAWVLQIEQSHRHCTACISGWSYQQVCGRIIAYQIGDPSAFVGAVRDGCNGIEKQYITGLSLTHGAVGARQHNLVVCCLIHSKSSK